MSNNEKLEKMKNELAKMRNSYIEEARSVLKQELSNLFVEFPDLNSISWNQYTPYWCDGDICEFSAHIDAGDLSINHVNSYDEEDDDFVEHNLSKENIELVSEKAAQILTIVEEEVLQEVFGDHVKVEVTREGVFTSHYDHN